MKNKANIRTQLIGQAGVWAVAAQLAIRGHVPLFPGVDYGYDLLLDNGLRIQVKTSRLTVRRRGKYGDYLGYRFGLRKTVVSRTRRMQTVSRNWKDSADFFVLWGVDTNKFWIIPTSSDLKSALWFASGEPYTENPRMKGGCNPQYAGRMQRKAECEGRWDLLEVNSVQSLVDEAATVSKENR